MAIEKTLNTRIKLRYDLYSNWFTNNPKLLAGEVALAYIPTGTDNSVSVGEGAVTGTTPPQVLMKIGDGEHNYNDLKYVSALAADVLAACKSENGLTTFINNVIDGADLADNEKFNELAGKVETLNGDDQTAGSVAKSIKDAIEALNLDETYVAIEAGKSLVDDTEIAKLTGVSEGANKVEASTNGKIKIDGVDTVVYTHPESHTASEISNFAEEVAKVKVANATTADKVANALTVKVGGADVVFDGSEAKTADVDTAIANAINAIPEQTDYTVTIEEDTTDSTIAKRYIFKQLGGEIGRIDLAKELVVTSGSVKEVTEAGKPYDGAVVGDKYIELVIANQDKPIYVPAKDLVDIYTAAAEAAEVQVAISNENVISATLTDAVKEKLNKAHEHNFADETALAGITTAKVTAWDAAEQNAKDHADGLNTAMNTRVEALEAIDHDHANKEELDKIADGDKAKWDTAAGKAHEHDNKEELDLIAAGDKAKWDAKVDTVTAAADSGLKATRTNNDIAIEIDDTITWVFDCGGSGVTA